MAALSNFIAGGGVPEYLEYSWLSPLSAAAHQVARNTIVTLSCTHELFDTKDNGTLNNHQITLNPGTYYFEATVPFISDSNGRVSLTIGLYSVTENRWYQRGRGSHTSDGQFVAMEARVNGQFVIAVPTTFRLQGIGYSNSGSFSIISGTGLATDFSGMSNLGDSTTDQRNTIKFWKLK